MKSYTYKFADGTTSTVEVEDELYKVLEQMDTDEHNNNRRETRKHDSYEWLEEQCAEPGESDTYFEEEAFFNMEDETLQAAVAQLPLSQQDFLRRRFYENKKVPEIAKEIGVSDKTAYKRYERIMKKLNFFLGNVEKSSLPWL